MYTFSEIDNQTIVSCMAIHLLADSQKHTQAHNIIPWSWNTNRSHLIDDCYLNNRNENIRQKRKKQKPT